jgi:hypothetical protein
MAGTDNSIFQQESVIRPLFGGAIQARIPASFRDVSDVRQVPDHQECWQQLEAGDAGGGGGHGCLLVVEVLQHQQDVANDGAAAYFFQDLAESNASLQSSFVAVPPGRMSIATRNLALPPDAALCFGVGHQRVRMGRDFDISGNRRLDQEEKFIRVDLCVIRLPSVSTDLLVTVSTPTANDPPNENSNVQQQQQPVATSEVFREVLSTLEIRDWGLFG